MLRTPLYEFHKKHGAKFVDFAGWEMPLLYNPPLLGGSRSRTSERQGT